MDFRDYEYTAPSLQYAAQNPNYYSQYYYYPGYGYFQQPAQEIPSIITKLNINSSQTHFVSKVVESQQNSMEDYIKRAFEKWVTVADRLAMSTAVKEVTAKAKQE